MAIANWGLVIEADEYWKKWVESRQSVYGKAIPGDGIDKTRHAVIKTKVREMHDQYIHTFAHNGQEALAKIHRHLRSQWLLELAAAKALHDCIDFLKTKRGQPSVPVICGPIMWKHLGLTTQVESLAASARKLDSGFKPAQDLQEFLSDVGLARILVREGQQDEALSILREYLSKNPNERGAKDLLVEVLLAKSETLAATELAEAIELIKEAKSNGANEDTIQNATTHAVLNRLANIDENLDESEAALKLGLKLAPKSQLLMDKYAENAVSRVNVYLNGIINSKPDPSVVVKAIEKAEKMMQDAAKVVGANHHKIQEKIRELQELAVVDKVNAAIERANRAINNYSPNVNMYSTISTLKDALRDLESAARQAPGLAIIQKHIHDLREVYAKVLNQAAVHLANSAGSRASYDRSGACNDLKSAEAYLVEAQSLVGYDRQISENLSQIRQMKAAIYCY
jgi:hypothetical protein